MITNPDCVTVFGGHLGVFVMKDPFEDDFEFCDFSDFFYCLPCHSQVSIFQIRSSLVSHIFCALTNLLKDGEFKTGTVELVELLLPSDSKYLGVDCDGKAVKLVFLCKLNGSQSSLPVD